MTPMAMLREAMLPARILAGHRDLLRIWKERRAKTLAQELAASFDLHELLVLYITVINGRIKVPDEAQAD